MKVLVLADLHLDFWLKSGRDPLADLRAEQRSDVAHCIIAGDLTNKAEKRWPGALQWLADRLPEAKLWVIPGNHDYYDARIDREDKLAAAAARAGAQWAQKRAIDMDGHRFLCCTLWTDFALHGEARRLGAMREAEGAMNDYRYIRVESGGFRRLKALDVADIHLDHRAWLEAELSRGALGEVVVVTHHAPHPDCIRDARAPAVAAYASDLSRLIDRHQPAMWIHGHTHYPVDFVLGRTRVTNASVGYPWQRPDGVDGRFFTLIDTDSLADHALRTGREP